MMLAKGNQTANEAHRSQIASASFPYETAASR